MNPNYTFRLFLTARTDDYVFDSQEEAAVTMDTKRADWQQFWQHAEPLDQPVRSCKNTSCQFQGSKQTEATFVLKKTKKEQKTQRMGERKWATSE